MKVAIRTLPCKAGAFMLLLFYLAAFVCSPIGLPHLHHEDEAHHTDSCANDACHLSIYHPGSEGGCHHKFHLTQTKEECDLCKIVLPRQIHSREGVYSDLKSEFSYDLIDYSCKKWISPLMLNADRGPPFLI